MMLKTICEKNPDIIGKTVKNWVTAVIIVL